MNELRAELRIKNNLLYVAITKKYRSFKAFAEAKCVSYSAVINYLNLTHSPWSHKDSELLTGAARKICDALAISDEELFPKQMYAGVGNGTRLEAIELPLAALNSLPEAKTLSLPGPEDLALNLDMADQIQKALDTIPARDAQVVRMHYGLVEGQPAMTFKEIGEYFDVSKERVRQIEMKALRRLRHPRRKMFEMYGDDYGPGAWCRENNARRRLREAKEAEEKAMQKSRERSERLSRRDEV